MASPQSAFNNTFYVYLFLALVAVAVVAYVVYQQCKPKPHEAFTSEAQYDALATDPHIRMRYTSEFDTLNPVLDAVTMKERKEKQHIDEAHTSLLERVDDVAVVKYGVIQDQKESSTARLPLYGLKCMWSKVDSDSGIPSQTKMKIDGIELMVTLFIRYPVGPTARLDIKSFEVKLSVDDTLRSFIPINTDVIHRKIAHHAKIVRVCIERKDASSKSVLGVEKICVVKYLPSAKAVWNGHLQAQDQIAIEPYIHTAGKRGVPQATDGTQLGNRLEMGVMLCDSVCLVSQSYAPTKQPSTRLATTVSIIADVSYGRVEPSYGISGTHSFRIRVSFADIQTKAKVTLCFAALSADNDQAFASYCASETNNPQRLPLLADSFEATTNTPTSKAILHPHNVAKATLFAVETNVVYECTIALARVVENEQTAFSVFALDSNNKNTVIQTMDCVPLNGGPTDVPIVLLRDTKVTSAYKTIPDIVRTNEVSVCSDYMVDADSTIMRFNCNSSQTSKQEMSECGVFSVNDGLVFCGSMLTPQHTGVANSNHLCSLSLLFTNNGTTTTIIIELTRDGVYIYESLMFGKKSLHTVPISIRAHDICWYIYVHKHTTGVCINGKTSFATSDRLKQMYEKKTHIHAQCFPVLTNVKLNVDPAVTLESRVITALAMKPTLADMKRARADIVNVLQSKASLLYRNNGTLTSQSTSTVIRSLPSDNPSCTMTRDSGISIQCEITETSIQNAIDSLGAKTFYNSDSESNSISPATTLSCPLKDEALIFELRTVRVVLQQQHSINPSPFLYNIAVYFTSETGAFMTTPTMVGSNKLFEATTNGGQPRVLIKYTNYENVERVCIILYDTLLHSARMHSSAEHQLSPHVLKRSSGSTFGKIAFHQHLADTLVCGARALSTNCNPFNSAKMCDCTGRISANPNNGITNNPIQPLLTEAMASVSENTYIENPAHETQMADVDTCVKYAGDTYGADGVASLRGQTCSIAKYPTNIKHVTADDTETNTSSYTFKNMTDEGMRLMKLLNGQAGV
jgi:hypothetical protein